MRKTWVICLRDWDNPSKDGLIPDVIIFSLEEVMNGWGQAPQGVSLSLEDEPAAYQVVGGVMAHQAYDG